MALDNLTANQIQAYEQQLLARVPPEMPIGNVKLRSQLSELGWDEPLYWDIRNHLMERGVLAPGKGKGGSVHLVAPPTQANAHVAAAATTSSDAMALSTAEPYIPEKDLYVPMKDAIQNGWAKDSRLDSLVVEITAKHGAKLGKWTKPDITVACSRTFPYVPGRHFDVITFEVKPQDQVNVTAVYEALAHLRAATRSYVLLHVPHFAKPSLELLIDETWQ